MAFRNLPELESWFLENQDTLEEFQGQFPPKEVVQEVGATWAETTPMNRQHSILQFLHGNSETISFTARLFAETYLDDLLKPLKMIISWAKRDPNLGRPPILFFWVGNATLALPCILEGVGAITYHSFRTDGSPRDVSFQVQLREWHEFSLEVEDVDTRYHRARTHDYYEWLAVREYGVPMLGVVVRQDHPTKAIINVGDIVKMPSRSNILKLQAKQNSIALRTAFGRRDTPQRDLRISVLDRLNISRISHVL